MEVTSITPIFIIGVPRSGTTLLRVLLDSHSQIAGASETPWILGSYGPNSLRELIQSLIEAKTGACKNLAGVDEEVLIEASRTFLNTIFSAYLNERGKTILVLKTPNDCCYLPFLFKLFPQALYLHIYRDGRDVASSTVARRRHLDPELYLGEINYENVIQCWADWESEIRRQLSKRTDLRSYELSYEKLVSEPEVVLAHICEFIGIPFEKTMVNYSDVAHEYPYWESGSLDVKAYQQVSNKSVGRWQSEMPKSIAYKLNKKHGNFLQKLGYMS